ncbi:protein-tyrosine-phosphatase [Microbacterium sp. 1154]|nr:protein-tyrosine-phosphatase [Microbacterium sp. 1154]
MAAGYLRALAGDSIDVYSAGSQPGNTVNSAAVTVMAEEGIDLSTATPQILTTDAVRQADVVITMCCELKARCAAGQRNSVTGKSTCTSRPSTCEKAAIVPT